MDEPAANPTPTTPPRDAPKRAESRIARNGFQLIALAALAVALVMALVSANAVVEIWFEARFVPIARLAFALAVGGVAIWVTLRLSGRKA